MQLKNTESQYGWLSIALHWLTAITVVGLFILGLWMETLGYYDPWYQTAPQIHKDIGVVLSIVVGIRLIWVLYSIRPAVLPTHKEWEKLIAKIVHWLLYGLMFAMFVTGYFLVTGKGKPLYLFDVIPIPAIYNGGKEFAEIIGDLHELIAYSLIGIAVLHALAAIKHHMIDKDGTLLRMLGRTRD